MKIRQSILITAAVILAVLGALSLASASPQSVSPVTRPAVPKSKSKALTGVSQGMIAAIDNNRLVLSHKKKGKVEERTFILSPQTERRAEMTVGEKVSVHYRTEGNQLIATAVQSRSPKGAGQATKPVGDK